MSDKIDVRAILQRLAPAHRDQLAKLSASPEAMARVMVEVRRSMAEREAARQAEMAQIEQQAAVEAVVGAVAKMAETAAAISARLNAIEAQNRRVEILNAVNYAAWRNGALHIDPERFHGAMGGENVTKS